MKVETTCTNCSKTISVNKWHLEMNTKRGYNFYCSSECREKYLQTKFWDRVTKLPNDGCWEISGTTSKKRYANVLYKGKLIGAHRYSYIITFGPIKSSDIYVCHRCDNTKCVRPDHLFLGSAKDNAIDCALKKRSSSTIAKKKYEDSINLLKKVSISKTLSVNLLEEINTFLRVNNH